MQSSSERLSSTLAFDRVQWTQLLEFAACEVFDIMLGTRLRPYTPAAVAENDEFTAMVGLAGSLCGMLRIRCANHSARIMASLMLGMPPEEVTDDSWDALGEVANMIAGNFKGKLSGIGNHCMLSVPTIIVGSDYQTRSLGPGKTLEAVFEFDSKPLWVTLELHD